MVKSNYAPPLAPLTLCRPTDGHGCLRVATPGEVEAYQATLKAQTPKKVARVTREDKVEQLGPRVLTELAKKPGTGSNLAARLKAGKQLVLDACRALEADGVIQKSGGPYSPWCLVGSVPTVPEPTSGTDLLEGRSVPVPPPPLGGGTPELISLAEPPQSGGDGARTDHWPPQPGVGGAA